MASLTEEKLTDFIGQYLWDPLGYVMNMFPWRSDPEIQKCPLPEPYRTKYNSEWGPDKWAIEFLEDWGVEIRKRKFNGTAVEPIRFSTASGHGIGKSTITAWIILFILDTRPYAKGVVTANTSDQLRTKTWAEVSKWHHLVLSSHLWDYINSRGNMSLSRRGTDDLKKRWRCDALTAKAEQSESFAGLHSASSTAFMIFDEASGIPDEIWEARFGMYTDGEPMSFDFGNPTRNSGFFYENTAGKFKHRFITRQIDSRNVHITNKGYIETLRKDWGEDSDIFKVRVKGQFPSIASLQFMNGDDVRDAQFRRVETNLNDPLVIGVDVARFGDNETVIYPRIGMDARSFGFRRYNRLDTTQVVDKVIETIMEFRKMGKSVSGLFVDGGGVGGGVVDLLRRLGYNPIDVNFGGRTGDTRFAYKGDEMWGNLRAAMPTLAISAESDLRDQLIQREYGFTPTGKIKLMTKDDMVEMKLPSPDIADALALTFATKVAPMHTDRFGHVQMTAQSEYDPYDKKAWEN